MKKIVLILTAALLFAQGQASAQFPGMPRVNRDSLNALTNADHAQMLGQLGLTSVRPGRDAYTDDPNRAPNYDEMKANPWIYYPDPLVTFDGKKVKNAKTWRNVRRPELVKAASNYRLVLFPCVNMDGRAISPDHRVNADPEECPRAGGGWWKDGTTIRWPHMKEYFPLPLDRVGYRGGYPNSLGYNIQHDASPGNIKTQEAKALLHAAEEKCVDLFLNFHSQPGYPRSTACGPQIYAGPANIATGKELAKRCNRALTAVGFPFDENEEIRVGAEVNINTAVQLCCGAPAITFEFWARDDHGFDRILETGYLWLETVFKYGMEKLFCDRASRKQIDRE